MAGHLQQAFILLLHTASKVFCVAYWLIYSAPISSNYKGAVTKYGEVTRERSFSVERGGL